MTGGGSSGALVDGGRGIGPGGSSGPLIDGPTGIGAGFGALAFTHVSSSVTQLWRALSHALFSLLSFCASSSRAPSSAEKSVRSWARAVFSAARSVVTRFWSDYPGLRRLRE